MASTKALEDKIQYHFTNRALLQEALLTSGNDHQCNAVEVGKPANKRLALLGDAVLRLAIVDHWWEQGDTSRRMQTPTYQWSWSTDSIVRDL
jgi:ribonuclease-3